MLYLSTFTLRYSCCHNFDVQDIWYIYLLTVVLQNVFYIYKGKADGDDILQSNNKPSSKTPRGHQTPAAFLMMASGLDKVCLTFQKISKFLHLL